MGMIIPKQTAAKTVSYKFTRTSLPKTVKVAGVLVAETIVVNEVDEDGAIIPAYDSTGTAIVLSATNSSFGVYSPITLQFVKPITANSVGVQLVE